MIKKSAFTQHSPPLPEFSRPRTAQDAPLSKAKGVLALHQLSQFEPTSSGQVSPFSLGQASLPKAGRHESLKQALLESHQPLLADNPVGVETKLELLKQSPFTFFRGTASFFYRDMAGTDSHLPKVLCNGDVHPQNFGVLRGADDQLFFGPNDPDEIHQAPFSWDLKRGATGFELMMRERGFDGSQRKEVSQAFAEGYTRALRHYNQNDDEASDRITADNGPKLVRDLLQKAGASDPVASKARMVDLQSSQFHEGKLKRLPERIEEFQGHVDAYRQTLGPDGPTQDAQFRVKDVAFQESSGVGSCGMLKYFVLLEGPSQSADDDVLLEFKQERASAMAGHTQSSTFQLQLDGARAATGMRVQNHRGDRWMGHTQLDDKSFLVAEYNPYYAEIDVEGLNFEQMKQYASVCGRALALSHARADEDTGFAAGSAEERILHSLEQAPFSHDIAQWASSAADQVQADYEAYCSLEEQGAFASLQSS